MSLKIQRIIFAILTIATFIAIFVFSGQDGDESSSTSRNFTRKIVDILPISKNLEEYKTNRRISICYKKVSTFYDLYYCWY